MSGVTERPSGTVKLDAFVVRRRYLAMKSKICSPLPPRAYAPSNICFRNVTLDNPCHHQ